MLVLSRKPGEEIVIGEDITVRLVEVRNNRVVLGIEAPRHVPIRRVERDSLEAERAEQRPREAS